MFVREVSRMSAEDPFFVAVVSQLRDATDDDISWDIVGASMRVPLSGQACRAQWGKRTAGVEAAQTAEPEGAHSNEPGSVERRSDCGRPKLKIRLLAPRKSGSETVRQTKVVKLLVPGAKLLEITSKVPQPQQSSLLLKELLAADAVPVSDIMTLMEPRKKHKKHKIPEPQALKLERQASSSNTSAGMLYKQRPGSGGETSSTCFVSGSARPSAPSPTQAREQPGTAQPNPPPGAPFSRWSGAPPARQPLVPQARPQQREVAFPDVERYRLHRGVKMKLGMKPQKPFKAKIAPRREHRA